jgi:hypothetical protein
MFPAFSPGPVIREPRRIRCNAAARVPRAAVPPAAGPFPWGLRVGACARRALQNAARCRVVHAALALLLLPAAGAAQGPEPLRVELNIPAQQLSVFAGAERVRTYTVSVGLPGYETPEGRFRITHAEWNPWWRPPLESEWARGRKAEPPGPGNPMGRVKLYFAPLYYIHGTPHRQDLGAPASRGCVRMLNSDAVDLAILLHAHAAPTLPAAEIPALLDGPRTTRISRFGAPVPFEVRYEVLVVEGGELLVHDDVYGRGRYDPEAVRLALARGGLGQVELNPERTRSLLLRARSGVGTFRIAVAELALREGAGGATDAEARGP